MNTCSTGKRYRVIKRHVEQLRISSDSRSKNITRSCVTQSSCSTKPYFSGVLVPAVLLNELLKLVFKHRFLCLWTTNELLWGKRLTKRFSCSLGDFTAHHVIFPIGVALTFC